MNINLLLTFIVLNIINVIIQTVKSIATVKCGKMTAALINAIAYGFYTVVVVYMLCDLPLFWKAIIVAFCNLVGVYLVKWGEERAKKDKLWKVEATIDKNEKWEFAIKTLKEVVPMNYIDIGKYIIINCFCATQKESSSVKAILDSCGAKYFASESKEL